MPRLADVHTLLRILANHGVDHAINGKRPGREAETGQTLRLTAASIVDTTAPYELLSKMRAGFWVIAPSLARMGEARVSLPGGCADRHAARRPPLMALEKLGAVIEIDGGYVVAKTPPSATRRRDRLPQGHGRRNPHGPDGRGRPPRARPSSTTPRASPR